MSSPLELIKPILSKLSSIFPNTYTTNTTDNSNINNEKVAASEDNTIDIQKTFSSENINITPIIKTILELHAEFPSNILNTKAGHKYNELEFFQSNQDSNATNNTKTNSNALFEKFNRTYTQLGKTLLQSIILEPTINVSGILKHRQAIAMAFMKHPQLAAIRKTLEECSKLERDILAMQMTDTPEMEEVYKVVFFQFRGLQNFNYHELFLKVFYYFIIIFSPIYGIVGPFVFMLAPYVFMRYVFKIPLPFETFFSILKKMVLGGTGFFSNLNKILNSGIGKVAEQMMTGGGGTGGGEGGSDGISIKSVVISMVKWLVAFMNSSGGTYVYLGFIICTYLYGIYNSIQVSITYNKIINMFHSRLNIISKWLKGAVNFYKMGLGFDFPEISPLISQMSSLMSNPTIINLLNHDTFKSEPGLLSNKGIIIKTFREFLDMKTLLAPFCKYMAHIDIWTGIGKWLQEGYGVDRTICSFAGGDYDSDIDTSSPPFVKGSNVWNICCDVPIYNDVALGQGQEQVKDRSIDKSNTHANLLITGPNGSGKSTYIKSVIECILLGQTLGVAPAKEFSFTPFTNIATYLNIPDCQGKESLFQAEMNRCYQQLEMLKGAEEKGQYSFNIMDEIFVSTNYQEGMSGAYAVIKRMCKMSKCLNIITTHFDVLAGMDELNVAKQYFDIEIDSDDNIIRDYKIKNGVSKKHLALKLLKKKGFDKSIIEDAEYLYDKLQKDSKKEVAEVAEVAEQIIVSVPEIVLEKDDSDIGVPEIVMNNIEMVLEKDDSDIGVPELDLELDNLDDLE